MAVQITHCSSTLLEYRAFAGPVSDFWYKALVEAVVDTADLRYSTLPGCVHTGCARSQRDQDVPEVFPLIQTTVFPPGLALISGGTYWWPGVDEPARVEGNRDDVSRAGDSPVFTLFISTASPVCVSINASMASFAEYVP